MARGARERVISSGEDGRAEMFGGTRGPSLRERLYLLPIQATSSTSHALRPGGLAQDDRSRASRHNSGLCATVSPVLNNKFWIQEGLLTKHRPSLQSYPAIQHATYHPLCSSSCAACSCFYFEWLVCLPSSCPESCLLTLLLSRSHIRQSFNVKQAKAAHGPRLPHRHHGDL